MSWGALSYQLWERLFRQVKMRITLKLYLPTDIGKASLEKRSRLPTEWHQARVSCISTDGGNFLMAGGKPDQNIPSVLWTWGLGGGG